MWCALCCALFGLFVFVDFLVRTLVVGFGFFHVCLLFLDRVNCFFAVGFADVFVGICLCVCLRVAHGTWTLYV